MKILMILLVPSLFILGAFQLNLDRAEAPPANPPRAIVHTVTPISPEAAVALRRSQPALAQNSLKRRAQQMTLRVRNISCAGIGTGSAFAVDRHTLVTNRHVLSGAVVIELNTWDGKSLEADINAASLGRLVDMGTATTIDVLPQVATIGPRAKKGAKVTAVGYPMGGPLTLSPGRVVRYVDGNTLHPSIVIDGPVMVLSTKIKHGNSGGPILDSRGRVVGVIYAGEPGARYQDYARIAYGIPITTLRSLIDRGGFQDITPCQD